MSASESRTHAGRAPVFAWVVVFLVAVALAVSVTLFVVNLETSVPPSWQAAGGPRNGALNVLNLLLQGGVALTAAILGALVIGRQPRNRVGWLMLWLGFSSALVQLLEAVAIYTAFTISWQSPLVSLTAWLLNWIWVLVYATILLLLAVFPTGRFLSKRWTWMVGLPLILFAGPVLFAATIETQMSSAFQISNPFITESTTALYNTVFYLALPMMPLTVVAVLAQMVARYRVGDFIARQQIKWLVIGIAAMLAAIAVGLLLTLLRGLLIGAVLVTNASAFPLLGIGVGMLRYRLYDVDLIIRRTAVYGLLTGALALIYFGSVIVMQSIAQGLTGQAGDSPLIIVASTLLIAAVFTPLRRRLQNAIDRRFYRRRYDAARTLAQFAQRARDEVELEALSGELVRVVHETMQPDRVTVWLKDGGPRK